MTRLRGFTLIESIIVIVIMGFAMITITQFLVPQITRSANPHYQVRAAALSQSVMSMVLARAFDEYSDVSGGELRCGEAAASGTEQEFCSGTDASVNALGSDGETIANYNDVDDYIGCWEPGGTNGCQDLNVLIEDGVGNTTYRNFRLDIQVSYQESSLIKLIILTVSVVNQPPIELRAYKGNY